MAAATVKTSIGGRVVLFGGRILAAGTRLNAGPTLLRALLSFNNEPAVTARPRDGVTKRVFAKVEFVPECVRILTSSRRNFHGFR